MVEVMVAQSSRDGSATPFVRGALTMVDPKKCLQGLDFVFVGRVVSLVLWLCWRGYGKIRVVSGRRSMDEQRRLYGLGRSGVELARCGVAPGLARPEAAVVTWCLPGASKHVSGQALDFDLGAYGTDVYPSLQEGSRLFGLQWGGGWRDVDAGHIEL
jgi:hypothetical protein